MNGATIMGIIFVCTSTANLLIPLFQRDDIWWTPADLAEPASACRNQVLVLVDGKPLEKQLEAGTLTYTADGQTRKLTDGDLRLRLNHWDARRADQNARAAWSALFVGAGIVLLVVGLLVLPRRSTRCGESQ